jgi:hypothetical protein
MSSRARVVVLYLVWDRLGASAPTAIVPDNRRQLRGLRHWLITVHDPGNLGVRDQADGSGKTVAPDEVDEFISTRFDAHSQDLVVEGLKRFCAGPL